jgi:ADP-heptose:LPS heptosyltransferase
VKPRLLVPRPGAIGDALLTAPALTALRGHFPKHDLWLASNATAAPVLAAMGLADAWWGFESPAVTRLFMAGEPGPDDAFTPIDVAVGWGRDPDDVLAASLRRRGADPVLIVPSRPAAGEVVHVARHLVRTLAPLGLADAGANLPAIQVSADDELRADDVLGQTGLAGRPFMIVHPGSGSLIKNWPGERFAEVVDWLRAREGIQTLLLAGPADDDVIRRVATSLDRPVPVLKNGPLLTVAALMRRARLYLGNDSGLTHLAGLAGLPTLALFGPTDPALWLPLGPRVRALRHNPLPDLDLETVLAELRPMLDG